MTSDPTPLHVGSFHSKLPPPVAQPAAANAATNASLTPFIVGPRSEHDRSGRSVCRNIYFWHNPKSALAEWTASTGSGLNAQVRPLGTSQAVL